MFGELGPADRVHGPATALANSVDVKQDTEGVKSESKKETLSDEGSSTNNEVSSSSSLLATRFKKTISSNTNDITGIETPQSINIESTSISSDWSRPVLARKGHDGRSRIRSFWHYRADNDTKVGTDDPGSPVSKKKSELYSDLRNCRVRSLYADTDGRQIVESARLRGAYIDGDDELRLSDQDVTDDSDEIASAMSTGSSSCLLSVSDVEPSNAALIGHDESDDQNICDYVSSIGQEDGALECDILDVISNPDNDPSSPSPHYSLQPVLIQECNPKLFQSIETPEIAARDTDGEEGEIGRNASFRTPIASLHTHASAPQTPAGIEQRPPDDPGSFGTPQHSVTGVSSTAAPPDPLEGEAASPEAGSDNAESPKESPKVRFSRRTLSAVGLNQLGEAALPQAGSSPAISSKVRFSKRQHSLAYSTELDVSVTAEQRQDSMKSRCSSHLYNPSADSPLFSTRDNSPLSKDAVSLSSSVSLPDSHKDYSEDGELFKLSSNSSEYDESSSYSSQLGSPISDAASVLANVPASPSTNQTTNEPLFLDTSSLSKYKPLKSPGDQRPYLSASSTAEPQNGAPFSASLSRRSKSAASLISTAQKQTNNVTKLSKCVASPIALPSREESLKNILTPVLITDDISLKTPTGKRGISSPVIPSGHPHAASSSSEYPVETTNTSSCLNDSSTFTRKVDTLNPEQYLIDAHKNIQKNYFRPISPSEKAGLKRSIEDSVRILKRGIPSKQFKIKMNSASIFSYSMLIIENLNVVRKEDRKSHCQVAVDAVKKLAFCGNANAQYQLGNLYVSGISCPSDNPILKPNKTKGFNFYVSASKQSHPEALFHLGLCYEEGVGVQKSYVRALVNYKKAAMLNHPGAMFRLGMCLLYGELRQPKQPREGIKWLKLAVKYSTEKYPQALYHLAMLHERGFLNVIWADHSYLIQLLSKAATLNHVQSQYLLGETYEYGNYGTDPDPGKSVYYYSLAAANGSSEAMFELGGWYLTGAHDPKTNFSIPQSDTHALDWVRLSAMANLPKGMYTLGYFYELGIGCGVNIEKSRYWYSAAAKGGDPRAKERVEVEVDYNLHKKETTIAKTSSAAIHETLFVRSYSNAQLDLHINSDFEKRAMDTDFESDPSSISCSAVAAKSPVLLGKNNSVIVDLRHSNSSAKESSNSSTSPSGTSQSGDIIFAASKRGERAFTSPVLIQATPSPPLTESAMGDFSTSSSASPVDLSTANKARANIASSPKSMSSRRVTPPPVQQNAVMFSPKSDAKFAPSCPTMNRALQESSNSKLDDFLNGSYETPAKMSFRAWNTNKKSPNVTPLSRMETPNKKSQTCTVS